MKSRLPRKLLACFTYVILLIAVIGAISEAENLTGVAHRTIAIEDVEIFYREAGNADCPTLLLLHGFPTSSAARLQVPLWRPTSVAIIAAAEMRPIF
jgi:hypothetical protein